MDAKDTIKQKLNIVDIVGEYVQIKKAGSSFKGLCPFHHEKSPSFTVSEDRQTFHCFGCNEGGDVISFVQKIEQCDFLDALKLLAPKAGLNPSDVVAGDRRDYSKRDILLDINKRSALLYNYILKLPQGKEALDYLLNRGVKIETIDEWSLGYAPSAWSTICDALRKRKFSDQQLLESGIAVKNEKGRYYDRFRDRITFPITDAMGRVVGFSARQLHEDKSMGKYINTPQTELYNKSEVIFGLSKAKKNIREKDQVILVEGNLDVLMSHQAGIKNCVATSGTALTEEQIVILKRMTQTFALCFDQDEAGHIAASRSFALLMKHDCIVNIIDLPKDKGVKDAADAVKIDPKLWADSVASSRPIMQYFFDRIKTQFDIFKPDQKRKAVDQVIKLLSMINNAVERDYWVAQAGQNFDIPSALLLESLSVKKDNVRQNSSSPTKVVKTDVTPVYINQVELLLAIMLKFPEKIPFIIQKINFDDVFSAEHNSLAKEVILYYNNDNHLKYQEFLKTLSKENLIELVEKVSLLLDKDFYSFTAESIDSELVSLCANINSAHVKQKIQVLQQQLSVAEREKNSILIDELMRKISQLMELRR